ncbi:hypothetical protein ABIB15_000216 [Marisediminicola sp. UYEF4]
MIDGSTDREPTMGMPHIAAADSCEKTNLLLAVACVASI